jgi:general L-amino acid transport system permease protein
MADVSQVQGNIDQPSGPRPPPASLNENNPIGWAKTNLFGSIGNTITTLVIIAALAYAIPGLLSWAVFEAVFRVDSEACRTAGGACWGVIGEKWRVMLFGRYPEELWRPSAMVALLIGMIVWSLDPARWSRFMGICWCLAIPAIFVLLGGTLGYSLWPFLVLAVALILNLPSQTTLYLVLGTLALLLLPVLTWTIDAIVGGGGALSLQFPDPPNLLTQVDTNLWGGLPLTLLLATVGIGLSFPLAIALALGRQSDLPVIKAICVGFIEIIRGVPLITILFMASLMIPLFLPEGVNTDQLVRAQIGFIFFSAAYVAEVIRGGLAAIPKGQYEAADALGLPYWYKTGFIILPQALKLVIMPMMNTFIGLFKDTSLVYIISMFDLLGAVNAAMTDPEWRKFHVESLVFLAVIYFAFCYSMARYAEGLEKRLDTSQR